jgi:hypothetical protein
MGALTGILRRLVSHADLSTHTSTYLIIGLRLDAQTALDHVINHPNLSRTPIVSLLFVKIRSQLNLDKVLYGQSIGGAVAIDLASRNPQGVCNEADVSYSLIL